MVTSRYKYTVNKEDISELYDMLLDPYESRNLIDSPKHQEIIRKMDDDLHQWVKHNGDNFFDGDSQFILDQYLKRVRVNPRDY